VDGDFSLLQPVDLITKNMVELRDIIKERREKIEKEKEKEKEKEREKERERERDREREAQKEKERQEREKERERERLERDREREKEKEKEKDRERDRFEREKERDRDEKVKLDNLSISRVPSGGNIGSPWNMGMHTVSIRKIFSFDLNPEQVLEASFFFVTLDNL
jgi:transducin (beta)-like 1